MTGFCKRLVFINGPLTENAQRGDLTVGIGLALLPISHLGPVADSAVLVEPQSGAAGVLLSGPVHAGVEDVAHAGVGVRVEPVQTGAQVAGTLGGL